MSISYLDILNYLKNNKANLELLLDKIDKIMKKGQDEFNIPIYTTKSRIKAEDSIFIKTKRDKENNLNKIEDIAGFRIVCLFEQDIIQVHNYIIKSLGDDNDKFNLCKFKYFNFDYDSFIKPLIEYLTPIYGNVDLIPKKKETGYKSIHYIFNYKIGINEYNIEIQLRTLLQDVWGELEHSICYKQGDVDPQIKHNFIALSTRLQADDTMIKNLKSKSDEERTQHLYTYAIGGPVAFYDYEKDLIPDIFKNGPLKSLYNSYVDIFKIA